VGLWVAFAKVKSVLNSRTLSIFLTATVSFPKKAGEETGLQGLQYSSWMEALVMEELDSCSHVVRIFRQDYHLSAKKQMNRESGLLGVAMAANNAGHTRSRGDWNPSGKCHDVLHEGVTLTQWRCESFSCVDCLWLKQQVCTETQMFLAARMH